MKKRLFFLIATFALLCWLLVVPQYLPAQTEQEIEKIENAAPEKATAIPKTPRKLLVVSIAHGFQHKSIPIAAKTIEILGEKTGAYTVIHAQDLNVFESNTLNQYDAVVFNNTTQLKFDNQKWRQNLLKFVRDGKGIIGIHAATDNFYDWPEGAALIGGLFDGHPWVSSGTWDIKIDEPDHPLNKGFEGKDFSISDEIYRIKEFSREYHRVLVSLDMSAEANLKAQGVKITDKDVPISWINSYGKGRVFYCSFGHNFPIFWTPSILQHYLDGIQYALGDYPVDDRPSVEKYLSDAKNYQWGQSRASLTMLSDFIRWAIDYPEVVKRTEGYLIDFLKDNKASLPGKQFICRQLSLIGTDKSVPTLAKMLQKEETADMALYALERIPGSTVDNELLKAAKKSSGRIKIGLINSLGVRQVSTATSDLTKWIYDKDEDVGRASVAALGKIGGPPAEKSLAEASGKTTGKLKNVVLDAYLSVADGYLKEGKTSQAKIIYQKLYVPNQSVPIRSAALRGLIEAEPDRSAQTVLEVLKTDDTKMQAVALGMVSRLPESQKIDQIAAQLPDLSDLTKIQLLTALSDRGDKAAHAAVLKAVDDPEEQVRIAALSALKNVGGASDVLLLATKASNTTGDERNAARESLYRLRGNNIDETILETIPKADENVKIELITATAERGATEAVDLLKKTAQEKDPRVRVESIKSLGVLAEPGELPNLIDLLIGAQTDAERREAERTVLTVTQKIPPKGGKAESILTVLPNVKDPVARGSLLQVLGRIGDRKALGVLRADLNSKNEEVKTAAIRALSEWPTSEPLDDLLAVAKNATNKIHQILALRGYIRLIDINNTRPPSFSLNMYKTAMELATETNEKRLVLSGLANVHCMGALNYVLNFISDPVLKGEAQVAAVNIANGIFASFPEETKSALDKVIQSSPNENVERNANRVLERISNL
jgi:type 1 glutamine amidotransferase/HEAT repeat protein